MKTKKDYIELETEQEVAENYGIGEEVSYQDAFGDDEENEKEQD